MKLDLTTNYYDFYVHLDTKNLSYFKDLNHEQNLLKKQNSDIDSPLEPLSIKTNISIYYCVHANANDLSSINTSGGSTTSSSLQGQGVKKYFLNRINLEYVLGYVRLKTCVSLDLVEFEMYNDDNGKLF